MRLQDLIDFADKHPHLDRNSLVVLAVADGDWSDPAAMEARFELDDGDGWRECTYSDDPAEIQEANPDCEVIPVLTLSVRLFLAASLTGAASRTTANTTTRRNRELGEQCRSHES